MNKLILLTNDLVPVYKNEEGIKLVNARELHVWLGVRKDFTTWIKDRINQFGFSENIDYTSFTEIGEREIGATKRSVYIISIDMAKELSMVERTHKGKQARQYFIKCEEKLKEVETKQLSPMDQLRLQYQVIELHEEKINNIENKVSYIENNMVIEHGQEVTVKKAVDKQVIKVCFGSEAPAYANKELRNRVYRALWRDYKGYFNIVSYHDTLKKDIEKALDLIKNWKPSGGLLREIQMSNTQITM